MPSPWPRRSRQWHRWGAILVAAPFLVVLLSGLLLLLKKEMTWVQPPTMRGSSTVPRLPHEELFAIVAAIPAAGVTSWEDIDRLDLRPDKGVVKVRCRNGIEVQLDHADGTLLQVAPRRSDWIEALHDGSWFHERAKLWVFLPSALLLLMLWMTGAYLWWLPHRRRRRKAKKVRP